jgi:uncharacterized surface anchored protein
VRTNVTVLPRRVAVAAIAALVALIWALGAAHGSSANAATIDGAITSVDIVQTSAGPLDSMKLELNWSVPDSAQPGDSFTLTLPPELKTSTTGFNLLAPDGSIVAKAVVVNGVVTFTVTDYVDTHDAVHGSAFFFVKWDLTQVPQTGPVTLDFKTSGKTYTDTVTKTGVTGTDRTKAHKAGSWTTSGVETGTDALRWVLDTPVGPWVKTVIDDKVGPGQEIDCSHVTYQLASDLDADGTPATVKTLPPALLQDSSCTTAELTATIGPIAAGSFARVKYFSTITDDSLAQYTNSATLTVDGTKTTLSNVRVSRHGAGGVGTGNTASPSTSPSTSPTSATVSPTSTSTTSSASPTSTSTSPNTSPTVLPTKITNSASATSTNRGAVLAFTGSNVTPMLTLAGLLLGGGALMALIGRPRRKDRRH